MQKKISYILLFLFVCSALGQECPKISFPTNGSTDIPVDVTITWPAVDGINGYAISLGTTSGGGEILNSHATGVANFYTAPVGLPENTIIYVSIVLVPFDAPPITCPGIVFATVDVTTTPPCTILVGPDNNAENVTIVTDIIWEYAPTATSYTLSIGTSEGGVDILDNLNVGNVLSYDPPEDLPQDTRIYVTISPENENGSLAPCTEESFFTGPLADLCEPIDEETGEVTSFRPNIEFPDQIGICANNNPITITSKDTADGFRWYKINEDSIETIISENRNVEIIELGRYRYEAYNNIIHSDGTIECAVSEYFTVVESDMATIDMVEVEKLPDGKQVTVYVSGIGDYEFAIDDENGPYRDNPVFKDVSEGPHVLYVRDKNGCGTISQLIERELKLEDFPNFFTPNGDGINDFWQFMPQLENAKTLEIVMGTISVYDRYGSLLVQIDPKSRGWDGSFNGQPLPASDYWFRAVSFDQREIKGHFTLKR